MLERQMTKLMTRLAEHVKMHSPDLKSVNATESRVCIADRHPRLNGCYIQIQTETDTDEAWYSIFQMGVADFEVVASIRGLGWRDVVIWVSNLKWEWEQIGMFFKDKPKCDWHSPITFLRLPEDSQSVSILGKTFYRDKKQDVYYVNSDNVIIRYYDDKVKVLDFCLEQGLVPKKIISTEEIITRSRLNNWIYNVEFENGGDKASARVVFWRKSQACEWI